MARLKAHSYRLDQCLRAGDAGSRDGSSNALIFIGMHFHPLPLGPYLEAVGLAIVLFLQMHTRRVNWSQFAVWTVVGGAAIWLILSIAGFR